MSEFAEIAKAARQLAREETREFVCVYCKRAFKKETTLASHMCEPKRRANRRTDPVIVVAFAAFQQFYASMHLSKNAQAHNQFESSAYYKAFVKYAGFITQHGIVAPSRYTSYLIKNNVKIDHWCKEAHYEKFLLELVRTESADDAITRTVKYIDKWADDNSMPASKYFTHAGAGKITLDISYGKISPWVLYNCDHGIAALDSLNEEQLSIVYPFIDPDFWSRKLASWSDKVAFVREVTAAIGFNNA